MATQSAMSGRQHRFVEPGRPRDIGASICISHQSVLPTFVPGLSEYPEADLELSLRPFKRQLKDLIVCPEKRGEFFYVGGKALCRATSDGDGSSYVSLPRSLAPSPSLMIVVVALVLTSNCEL
jgi:hypothetical protein